MDSVAQKQCLKCGETFPGTTEYFPKSNGKKSSSSGLHGWCKRCKRSYDRDWERLKRGRDQEDRASYRYIGIPETYYGQDTPGFVCLFQSGIFYKIGLTTNPKIRLRVFNIASPVPIDQVCVIHTNNMAALEAELHDKFKTKHHHGEWFVLDDSDVEYIKQLAT